MWDKSQHDHFHVKFAGGFYLFTFGTEIGVTFLFMHDHWRATDDAIATAYIYQRFDIYHWYKLYAAAVCNLVLLLLLLCFIFVWFFVAGEWTSQFLEKIKPNAYKKNMFLFLWFILGDQFQNSVCNRGGTEPGSARLASIRGKSSGKARLGAGSKIFGS